MNTNTKTAILSTVSAGVVGSFAFLLKDKKRREKAKEFVGDKKDLVVEVVSNLQKSEKEKHMSINTGHPDPENVEDNKMVAEGGQFPVQYYNKVKEEK